MIVSKRVISLSGSPRTKKFFAQPQARDFQLFAAFDGFNRDASNEFDLQRFEERYGRQALRGEVGVAISHSRLWREFADEDGGDDDLMLVAEDDAVLSPDLETVLPNVLKARKIDLVNLGIPGHDFRQKNSFKLMIDEPCISLFSSWVGPKKRPWAYRLGPSYGGLTGMGLYLVSRSVCRAWSRFVEREGKISWLADDYLLFSKSGIKNILMVCPNLCGWLGGSEIAPDRDHFIFVERRQRFETLPLLEKLKYQFGRKSWRLRANRLRRILNATSADLNSRNSAKR